MGKILHTECGKGLKWSFHGAVGSVQLILKLTIRIKLCMAGYALEALRFGLSSNNLLRPERIYRISSGRFDGLETDSKQAHVEVITQDSIQGIWIKNPFK